MYHCTADGECPEGFYCSWRGRCERGCRPTNGGNEVCDGVDNDCDGETDEGLLNRCGECLPPDDALVELCGDRLDNDCDGETDEGFERVGTACVEQGCAGYWVCTEDLLGEECDAPEPAEQDATCDGVDEDCDGQTDEDTIAEMCPQQNGVCAGAEQRCLPGGVWSVCDYGPDYTEGVDAICDTLDNDCDGQTDEDAEVVLEGELAEAAADRLDNNCNGLIDEPGGVMVPVPSYIGLWIDAYEVTVFDNPGCAGTRFGAHQDDYPPGWPAHGVAELELFACSLPGVVPSGHLSWYRAQRACQAQGKQLCTGVQWTAACGAGILKYPYGPNFIPGKCNDPYGGAGEVRETGAFASCSAPTGACDMSGNLAEWLLDLDEQAPGNALTAGFSYLCEFCYLGASCDPCDPDDEEERSEIEKCCGCDTSRESEKSFPREMASEILGTRCCLTVP